MGITNRDTGELITGIVDALSHPKQVFAATRVATPPVTFPTGPSVLLDNFDDLFNDKPYQTYVMSAKASATGAPAYDGGWYCYADPATSWVGIDNAPLVTYEVTQSQGQAVVLLSKSGYFCHSNPNGPGNNVIPQTCGILFEIELGRARMRQLGRCASFWR